MIRIAVADDDSLHREVVATMLEREGHWVEVAANGRECLELVDSGAIDLVVTDVFMPGGDGLSLLAAIRGRQPQLPVIAMTGGLGGLSHPRFDAMRALGAQAVLAKPFTRRELTETAMRVLAEARP